MKQMSNEQEAWVRHMESVERMRMQQAIDLQEQEKAQEKALENRLKRDRRERIATAVLAGLMARQPLDYNGVYYNGTVADAVAYADALIAELDKPKEEKT